MIFRKYFSIAKEIQRDSSNFSSYKILIFIQYGKKEAFSNVQQYFEPLFNRKIESSGVQNFPCIIFLTHLLKAIIITAGLIYDHNTLIPISITKGKSNCGSIFCSHTILSRIEKLKEKIPV